MPVITLSNPDEVHAPVGNYRHAAVIEGAARRLLISGQIGMARDGRIAEGGEGQIRQALANLGAVLAAHGMAPRDVAKVTVFLTDRALLPLWRAERAAFFGDHVTASTLLIVAGLADPRLLIEVEAEAAA